MADHDTTGPDTWTRDRVTHALALAFESGRAHERARVGTELAALNATWRPLPRRTWHEQVAARVAEMEAYAAGMEWSIWRGQYPGGPVDFETGRLRVVFSAPGAAA